MSIPYEMKNLVQRLADYETMKRLAKEITELTEELEGNSNPDKALDIQKKKEAYEKLKKEYFVVIK